MSARKIIDSPSVIDYLSSAELKKVFSAVDELRKYTTEVCGKPDLRFVRLTIEQYSHLDDAIRTKSDKRRNIHDVTYHGLPIINETESPPCV